MRYESVINLLKPTGYVIIHIQEFYILPHCIYVFWIYLRTNSDFSKQRELIGLYNRDENCLLWGKDCVFK